MNPKMRKKIDQLRADVRQMGEQIPDEGDCRSYNETDRAWRARQRCLDLESRLLRVQASAGRLETALDKWTAEKDQWDSLLSFLRSEVTNLERTAADPGMGWDRTRAQDAAAATRTLLDQLDRAACLDCGADWNVSDHQDTFSCIGCGADNVSWPAGIPAYTTGGLTVSSFPRGLPAHVQTRVQAATQWHAFLHVVEEIALTKSDLDALSGEVAAVEVEVSRAAADQSNTSVADSAAA